MRPVQCLIHTLCVVFHVHRHRAEQRVLHERRSSAALHVRVLNKTGKDSVCAYRALNLAAEVRWRS